MGKSSRAATALTVALGAFALAAAPVLAAATSYPNDYFFARGEQWALTGATSSINTPAAWCTSTGASETVAMVDTGADFNHPELAGKLIAGVAFTGGNATTENDVTGTGVPAVSDADGHGTGTTGLIVAATDNSQGIAAVAPDAKALVVNVRGSDGSIYNNDVAAAMEWAADHGANVINVSIEPGRIKAGNTNAPDLTIPTAAAYAAQRGVAVTLAVGNDGSSQAVYPNISNFALVVGALTPSGTMSSFSNHGNDVSIWAPGGTTMDTSQMNISNSVVTLDAESRGYQYAIADGTSISAPLVAGTLALLMSKGDSASAAMSAVRAHAVTRNGLPELDSAAALGVSDSQRCGTPQSPPSGTPPPVVTTGGGGGGTHTPAPTRAPATPRTTTTTSTTTQQTTSTTTTTSTTSSGDVAGAVQSPGDSNDKGGRQALPPAQATPSGGVPLAPILGGVAVLAIAGPLGFRLVRARRGRGVAR